MTRVCALPHYWLRHPNASSGRRHAAHLACHTLNPSERPVLAVLCTTQMFSACKSVILWMGSRGDASPSCGTLWHHS